MDESTLHLKFKHLDISSIASLISPLGENGLSNEEFTYWYDALNNGEKDLTDLKFPEVDTVKLNQYLNNFLKVGKIICIKDLDRDKIVGCIRPHTLNSIIVPSHEPNPIASYPFCNKKASEKFAPRSAAPANQVASAAHLNHKRARGATCLVIPPAEPSAAAAFKAGT